MIARTIADIEGTADVLDHHSRGAHQPTATSTAQPTSVVLCSFCYLINTNPRKEAQSVDNERIETALSC